MTTTASDLTAEIERIVLDWWKQNEAPLLLSKLGSALPTPLQNLVRVERIQLKRLIQQEMPDRIRLLGMARHGGGVAPVEQTKGLTEQQLDDAFEAHRRSQVESRIPRYNSCIWDAFKTPLLPGRRRFVAVSDRGEVHVREIGSDEEPPSGSDWLELEREYLDPLHEGGFPKGREIDQAIRQWANGKIETDRLLYRPDPSSARSGASQSRSHRTRVGTLDSLVLALRGLTNDELARIQVPADVILSFLERSSRSQ